ncbi:uracil-DNA glycosylase [Paradesulfitobacterium ferrireducens]|uniref:uracil-DNA glycosylase n=1 Tax=Paradesulfitobacterium ferrireducens TaxID=2816476 RepID=UPI001F45C453|nr:uracil-DNA glycosylase [Paradesulfitobacterium ferrireducens]
MEIAEHMRFENLPEQAQGCRRCALGETRRSLVFGEGNLQAQIMLVGEAPGEKEDVSGRPFVGPAGRMLNKILEETGLRREDIYITGVVKCRPPGNRLPKKDEVEACVPFLHEQIRSLQPKIIVCLGSLAAKTLIDPKLKISEARGQWVVKDGAKFMPTYHPASVFHDREKLDAIREDFLKVREALE